MRILTDPPPMVFFSLENAEKVMASLGFEKGETRIRETQKDSGRYVIEVLDLDDGLVIGHI